MQPSIVIVGSSNTDMVIKSDHLPVPGETILGGVFFMNAGGKGANQAVAAKRLDAKVTLICKIGKDVFGEQALKLFEKETINTEFIVFDDINPSGVALITVDKNAENCIVVASGSNATLLPGDLVNSRNVICNASIVLMQLEIPLETVSFVADMANFHGVKVILNPAPACNLPLSLLKNIWIITPNEKEAEMLTGITITDNSSIINAAQILLKKGVKVVIITLGSKGAYIATKDMNEFISAPEVLAIDSTAAGDVFNGSLAVALSENMTLLEAVNFACHSAAMAVTKLGAQTSAPFRHEVESFMLSKDISTC